jgi:hypothetical protein
MAAVTNQYLKMLLAAAIFLLMPSLAHSEEAKNSPQFFALGKDFQYGEVIKSKIGIKGGIIKNVDETVIVVIPSVKQEREFTLSFKKSTFEVKDGFGSPVMICISPDISLMDPPIPIKIKVKYDTKYLPVPYLIDDKNKMHVAQLAAIDKETHYFTFDVFHGGDYSWVYAKINNN